MFLFTNDIIVYVENPKEPKITKKKLLKLINNYKKISGYKFNIQIQSVSYLQAMSKRTWN